MCLMCDVVVQIRYRFKFATAAEMGPNGFV